MNSSINQIAKQYRIPLETVAKMQRDGILLTQLLTADQVAERFQTNTETVYRLVRNGELQARKLKGSKLLRFDPTEIEASDQPPAVNNNVLRMKR